MAPRPAPPSIGRCSAASRSFLRGPNGPAGAPPGHRLRSGVYMAASRKRDQTKISPIRVSTLSGEPRVPLIVDGDPAESGKSKLCSYARVGCAQNVRLWRVYWSCARFVDADVTPLGCGVGWQTAGTASPGSPGVSLSPP